MLVPLARIGDRAAPALRLIVCEPLGALITAHKGKSCTQLGPRRRCHSSIEQGTVAAHHHVPELSHMQQFHCLAVTCLMWLWAADGSLRLHALPHYSSPDAIRITYQARRCTCSSVTYSRSCASGGVPCFCTQFTAGSGRDWRNASTWALKQRHRSSPAISESACLGVCAAPKAAQWAEQGMHRFFLWLPCCF